VMWRSSLSKSSRAKARRCRVGRNPTARSRAKAVAEGEVIIM
jgi:hypothetical protein